VGGFAVALCPGPGISFSPARLDSEQPLPATLFNSAAENLLENALAKKKDAPKLQISVGLGLDPQPTLTVCDDGAAIPAEVRETLLREPVASSAGLGIGLYQTARHAQFYGYELRVMCNEPGRVCFELGRPAEADSATVG
jgi:sensor histidine kinase regulating citrate/malate metabolism